MPLSFPANPTLNQTYVYSGVTWTFNGNGWTKGSTGTSGSSSGGATVTVSNVAPSNPTSGALWIDSDYGDLNAYFSNAWAIVGSGGTVFATPPTISNITGNIVFTVSSSLTLFGNNFGTLQGTLRYNFAGNVIDSYILPTTTTSLTTTVPAAVYNSTNSGTIGNIVWYRADGSASNSYVMTVQIPPLDIQYLVVAGGGGSSNNTANDAGGGGGGAGGYLTGNITLVVGTAYTVTVGGGGALSTQGSGSQFNVIQTAGGGIGGAYSSVAAGSGGSGGGSAGAMGTTFGSGNTPATTPSQGNNGGDGGDGPGYGGGGGGGAGGVGASSPGSDVPGTGGVGLENSITGTPIFYAGGGGGGTRSGSYYNGNGGLGGNGGGGQGGGGQGSAVAGTANRGGGAGGGRNGGPAATGGSGIVVISIPSTYTATFSGGLTTTANTTAVSGRKVYSVTAGTGTVTFSV